MFRRYRESILDPGTALSCRDAFEGFRGRDPLPDALMNTFDTASEDLPQFKESAEAAPAPDSN